MTKIKNVYSNNIIDVNASDNEEDNLLPDNRKGKKSANNISPSVENEPFKCKRCYQFRESTIRLLNEMKAKHPDVNVYLNKLIDDSIWYYYKNNFEKNKNKR